MHPAPDRVALVTATAMADLDEDLVPLADALRDRGLVVELPAWDDPSVDWASFDLAVLRSPWDYVDRYPAFLAWLDAAGGATALRNPPAVVRWSTDKRYLVALADAGVPVVPTAVVEPGQDPSPALAAVAGDEVVVKPVVSAGSRDTARHTTAAGARAHADRLLARGAAVLVQPYLGAVDERGESALVHFRGQLSHGLRKGPLLAPDAPPSDAPFAPEELVARDPTRPERAVADHALAAAGAALGVRPEALLYARVDLLDGPDGPVLLELELAEPSFFVAFAPGAADRFADAVVVELAELVRPGG